MSWLENTSQIKGLPDVAINPFSFIDCDALTNDITIIFYVCILYIIRNLISTTKLGAMYPFNEEGYSELLCGILVILCDRYV